MSAARKAVQTLAAHLLVFVQGLVLTPLVIKTTGAQAYGGYVLLMTALAVLAGISPLGVGLLARRELPAAASPEHRARLFYNRFWFQLCCAAGLGVLVAAVLAGSDRLRADVAGDIPIWLPAAYLVANAIYAQGADYFRYTHRGGTFNLAIVVQPWLFVLLAVAGHRATGRLDPPALVAAMSAASLVVGGALLAGIVRELGVRAAWPGSDLRRELHFGLPLILGFLVDAASSSGDRYLVATFLGVQEVGAYAPACALGALALVVPRVFGVVLPPLLALRLDTGGQDAARRLVQGAVRCFMVAGIPLVCVSAVLGEPLLRAYADAPIAAMAWPVMPVIALATLFNGCSTIQSMVLVARLRTAMLLRANVAAAALVLSLDALLLMAGGGLAAAALAALAGAMLRQALLARALGGDPVAAGAGPGWILRVAASGAAMAAAMLLARLVLGDTGAAATLAAAAAGAAVYAAAILLQPRLRADLRELAAQAMPGAGRRWTIRSR